MQDHASKNSPAFHFLTPVWGDEHICTYLNTCLPCQLTPGNLQAFSGSRSNVVYKIITTSKDAEVIRKSEPFAKLCEWVRAEFVLTDGKVDCGPNHRTMTQSYLLGLESAGITDNVAYIFLTGDSIWADGSFKRLKEIVAKGYRAVMVPGCRVEREGLLLELDKLARQQQHYCFHPRRLTQVFLSHLHRETESFVWGNDIHNILPAHLIWPVLPSGLLIRAFVQHPLLVYPEASRDKLLKYDANITIDGDFVLKAVPEVGKIYFVQDSDDILGLDLAARDQREDTIRAGAITEDAVARWLRSGWPKAFHRVMASFPYRVHAAPIDDSWVGAEATSAEILENIKQEFYCSCGIAEAASAAQDTESDFHRIAPRTHLSETARTDIFVPRLFKYAFLIARGVLLPKYREDLVGRVRRKLLADTLMTRFIWLLIRVFLVFFGWGIGARWRSRLYGLLSEGHYRSNRLEVAQQFAEQAVMNAPAHIGYRNLLIDIHKKTGRLGEAIAILSRLPRSKEYYDSVTPDLVQLRLSQGQPRQAYNIVLQAIDNNEDFLTKYVRLVYDAYTALLKQKLIEDRYVNEGDPEFEQRGFIQGVLDKQDLELIRRILLSAEKVKMDFRDADPEFVNYPGMAQEQDRINRSHDFFKFTPDLYEQFTPVFKKLGRRVEQCLGMPWRILSLKAWVAKAGPERFEEGVAMNRYHTDGFPVFCRKILIYVTGSGPEKGTTEILYPDMTTRVIEGPPGTWVHFKSNEILHRGVASLTTDRIIVDVTIGPALRNDPRPANWHGLNAYYPFKPWMSLY